MSLVWPSQIHPRGMKEDYVSNPYCCTVHFEDSLSITHQRVHKLYIVY